LAALVACGGQNVANLIDPESSGGSSGNGGRTGSGDVPDSGAGARGTTATDSRTPCYADAQWLISSPAFPGVDRVSNTSETETLRAEVEALRETANRLEVLLDTTDTAFVILDETGRVVGANAEYVKLTGHDRIEQIVGRSVTDWTAPGDRDRNAEEVRRCLEEGSVRNLEIDYVGPDGRIRPVELNASALHEPNGVTIFTVCRDNTARRQADEALRNSERRYRTTIDSMGEAIHVVDADLRIELLNRTGERWMRDLGICGDIVGRQIFDVFPFLPDSVRDEYRQLFAGEEPLITRETNTVGGREVETETRKIPIVEGGRVVRVVTVIGDVTDSVRAHEKLRHTEKMDALGQLAGGVAHDFNNHLAAVLGYAELLAQRIDEPQLKEYAAAIVQIAQRSADLTRQLLTFARKGRARSVPVDLHDLIRDVSAILSRTIDPQIAIRSQLRAPRAVTSGDPAQLQSALLNLAINARDAMPHGGELSFATDIAAPGGDATPDLPDGIRTAEHLRVRISDTGSGMTDEVRRRIFEPFFTTKEPGSGTGLGLAAVYGTVTNHHGAIRVDTEPGRGTTFTVLLPLVGQIGVDERPASEKPAAKSAAHVLFADDEPSVRRVIRDALTNIGYRVTAHADGVSAVSFYRDAWHEIDLVLLDMKMPALCGTGALLEMRRINPAVRAILCSGHAINGDEQRVIDDTKAGFLPKPFALADLARLVAATLSGTGT
jgi:PAS domain S-box-containing protein